MYDGQATPVRRPPWIKRSLKTNQAFFALKRNVREKGLATVCQSARCPNIAECWSRGVVTVMILGDVCTRSCRFCAVSTGSPAPPDPHEPQSVAELVKGLGATYVVLTSVDRDDLSDGGASFWAETINLVKSAGIEVEVLVPDFRGDREAQDVVFSSEPDVFCHNIETVPSLQKKVRPQASYARSLGLLGRAVKAGFVAKSGFMVGFGETMVEIEETLVDLADTGIRLVTVGQYLQARDDLLPVVRFWSPQEFEDIGEKCNEIGLRALVGPMVRSSYRADELARRGSESALDVGHR